MSIYLYNITSMWIVVPTLNQTFCPCSELVPVRHLRLVVEECDMDVRYKHAIITVSIFLSRFTFKIFFCLFFICNRI